YAGWPEAGELIVGEVDEIADFGVFVDLTEYRDRRGLVHISEVASGWIKNVRDHVREGQTIVAKVLSVDEDAQQIDLSLKDVNEHQRKETIQEW
ncbi:S1 RNA-binding domain-containing protein, partial [Hydrogenobacter sp. Uz 6-8]|uniref:S1 RNA-binding domain-containing protein n=1 Tax=Hydrogenobacter sp. Uz 6-8 TaxID=3384828 RepID=UPI0038FC5165